MFKSKVKVTMTFITKKAYNFAMLMVRALKLSRDVGPHHKMSEGNGQSHQDL